MAAPPPGQGCRGIGDGLQADEKDRVLVLHRGQRHQPAGQNEIGIGIAQEHFGAGFGDGFAVLAVDVQR